MKKGIRNTAVLLTLTWLSMLLLACGNEASTSTANSTEQSSTASETQSGATAESEQTTTSTDSEEAQTRQFTDWTGHEVEIPVTPQRVIYHGEVTGDLLALGVVPVGILRQEGTVYDDQVTEAEDVGFPISVEKSLSLNPDLIIFSNSDENQYEALSKVAPTVTFNSFDSIEDRMSTLGDILNKKEEAEAWITAHQQATEAMWQQLHDNGLQTDETASVFTMYPGNRLFVMAGAGLPQLLYGPGGLKPTAEIQKVLDEELGFVEISTEKLPDFAGDRIFILNPVPEEAKQLTKELLDSSVWKNLPAVKAGHVYEFDIVKASSDAVSREWLLKELPKQIKP